MNRLPEHDRGFTHIALQARDPAASAEFYRRYAGLEIVHSRTDAATGTRVLWLGDRIRPFVLVLIESAAVSHTPGGFAHLGVACASRAEVDRRLELARTEGRETIGPIDHGPPVGYWGFVTDPDGHNLELSFGQEVGAVAAPLKPRTPRRVRGPRRTRASRPRDLPRSE